MRKYSAVHTHDVFAERAFVQGHHQQPLFCASSPWLSYRKHNLHPGKVTAICRRFLRIIYSPKYILNDSYRQGNHEGKSVSWLSIYLRTVAPTKTHKKPETAF